MNTIIKTKQLSKQFKKEEVIKPLDFVLNEGEICALIGKNGAGKSTFFKMLAGQILPTSGEILLFGKSHPADINDSKKRMGFMIESPAFFPDFTAFQNLDYFRLQRGVTEKNRIYEVLKLVGLANDKKKKFSAFSMGMKQRLGIALCLLSSPDCLVLDEPINGLDTEGIIEVRNLLLKLNQEHHITIFVSSHILTELQIIADRFVFMKDGVIVEDILKEALEKKSEKQICIHVDDPAKAVQLLERTYPDIHYQVMPQQLITVDNYIHEAGNINRLLIDHGVLVTELRIEAYKLEEYFLGLVEDKKHD